MPVLKSVSSELPDPPYPEDTKANGYKPEFDIRRIKASKTWKLADPKIRNILLRLWLESWEEIPAGSFENDDELIAASIDVDLELFQGYRKQIMRGWKLHSDGRLYHQFIAEQVLDMLKKRRKSTDKVRDWRKKKALENAKCNRLPTSNQPVGNRQEQEQEQETGRVRHTLSRSDEKSQSETRNTEKAKTSTKDKPHATLCALEDVEQVLDLLNNLSGHTYRLRNARGDLTADAKRIRTRIDQWSLQDVLNVVEKKCAQWKNDETMRKYLRPGTLFRPEKFEQYLGERQTAKATPGSFLDDSPVGNIFEGEYARA